MRYSKGQWKSRSTKTSEAKQPTGFEIYVDSETELERETEKIICDVFAQAGYREEMGNAALMAAAPDLLNGYLYILHKLNTEYTDADADYLRMWLKSVCVNNIKKADQGLIIENL